MEEFYLRDSRELRALEASRRGSGGYPQDSARFMDDVEQASYDRFRNIRERRLARNFTRRHLDRILQRRHLSNLNLSPSSSSSSPNRPIDDWAINRRIALQHGQARDAYGLRSSPSQSGKKILGFGEVS